VKRITRSWLAMPRPERIETDAAKLPSAWGLIMGETRYLPTSMLFLVCIFLREVCAATILRQRGTAKGVLTVRRGYEQLIVSLRGLKRWVWLGVGMRIRREVPGFGADLLFFVCRDL
jgi:hypothetical protein